MPAILAGFLTGLSLIVAIGAQNAYVLRQGLAKTQVTPVVVVCAASDAVLIVAGIAGLGVVVEAHPMALTVLTWFGAAFLTGYGLLALRRALHPDALSAGGSVVTGTGAAIAVALALTWLNPHVYLDTVLLLGSVGSGYGSPGRWWFAAGAAAASAVWFSALGYGARWLAPLFARPLAWRVLDGLIGVTMLVLAALLYRHAG